MTPADQANRVVKRLRARDIKVVVTTMSPRPWSAAYFRPNSVLLHHTASTSTTSVENEKADVAYIKRVPWGGPASQWYVGRTGTVYLICKGGANHAGTGAGLVSNGVPNDQGNYKLWGIEVQSHGLEQDWTDKQVVAVHALTAELLKAMGQETASRVWRHKDYDTDSGKIDTQYSLDFHRKQVKAALDYSPRKARLQELRASLRRQLARVVRKLKSL